MLTPNLNSSESPESNTEHAEFIAEESIESTISHDERIHLTETQSSSRHLDYVAKTIEEFPFKTRTCITMLHPDHVPIAANPTSES